jgi:hypothetical protein
VVSEGPFEIRTPHWRASFQRRVHDPADSGRSPNRGVLPFVVIGKDIDSGVILVPLADTEALWIALMCSARAIVRAQTADKHPIVVSRATGLPDGEVLLALDAVHRDGTDRPIDHRSVPILRSPHSRPDASLTATIDLAGRESRLRICLATPSVYTELSGRPAPPPTTPEHAYGKWRLP